jgi:ATP-dependent Lon protease
MKVEQVDFAEEGISTIAQFYTREAGVRNLEREIASVLRKLARRMLTSEDPEHYQVEVTGDLVKELLGPTRFRPQSVADQSEVGLATGLAWTEVGGEVLHIEATLVQGRGNITLTGKLGEVMQESAQAAYSYAKSRAVELGINEDDFENYDIHVHVPEGAIPKDGPSAGITMATALVSVLSRRPVRKDLAMTGEITLRGNVLPVGGVKEKVLAARRARVKTVILPEPNKRDLEDLPQEVLEDLTFIFVENVRQVFDAALQEKKPAVKARARTAR